MVGADPAIGDLLDAVGLTDHARTSIGRLSGGQRRRLDIAIGLVGRPDLVLLDEPTVGLDPEARAEFHRIIRAVTGRYDTTVLFTTHDLDEAEKISDRILILADGRVVADGSPDQLRGRVGSTTEIIWTDDTGRHVHATEDPTGFLRAHLAAPEARMDALEVRRSTLEDVYLSLIRRVEHGEDLALPELSASPSGAGTHPTEDR